MQSRSFIGRQRERAELNAALASAEAGEGRLLLLAGEAGVGKTRLAEEVFADSEFRVLRGSASEHATPPYGPILAALRGYLREAGNRFEECGPLVKHLSILLPELGYDPEEGDQATLFEAIACAFRVIARREATALFLDDLQWADSASLELLPTLAEALAEERILLLGAYRSDDITRGHPIRRLRDDLRRARLLKELAVEPLDRSEAGILAARFLGGPPSKALLALLYDRTQGLPFFVEELSAGLAAGERLQDTEQGFELGPGEQIPIPDTVLDAIRLRLDSLPKTPRRLLDVAAVAGLRFDLAFVTDLAGSDEGVEALLEHRWIVEDGTGEAAFRHALTREAIYTDIVWPRRRALHRQIAKRYEAQGELPEAIAEHWFASREFEKARRALLLAADRSCGLHAYRDAAQAANRALEIWPEGVEEVERLRVLDQLGLCLQLSGSLAEAARAWNEAAAGWQAAGDWARCAEDQRRLAMIYELQGNWPKSMAARRAAAESFAQAGLQTEAVVERLAMASHLQSAGHFTPALEWVVSALGDAGRSGHVGLVARAQGLQGQILAKLGRIEEGRAAAQSGLTMALEHNLSGPAAEIYQRLASVLEQDSDQAGAMKVYQEAVAYCEAREVPAAGQLCLACLTNVMRKTGEWNQAASLCEDIISSNEASRPVRAIAVGVLGSIYARQGDSKRARVLLTEALAEAQRNEMATLTMDCAWFLGIVDDLEDASEAAADHARYILERWRQTEDRYYGIFPLRWSVTYLARQGASEEARECAGALAEIAASTGNPEALAGLAHALGEIALLDGDPATASDQFRKALELLDRLDAPLERVETLMRSGAALVAAGNRDEGIHQLAEAYHTADRLQARSLQSKIIIELERLGEKLEERLGRRAAGRSKRGGLTRRQLEVMRLISAGLTNHEIARELVLSTRTVDTHVSNILDRLNCRSRAEAVRKAAELKLLS